MFWVEWNNWNLKWTTLLAEMPGRSNSLCYWQQMHSASDCQVVRGIDTRKQILKTSGRFFNCLAKGHVVNKCQSSPQCQKCQRKHHPGICNQTPIDSRNLRSLARTTTEATNVSVLTLNPKALPFIFKSSTNASLSMTARSFLLQTARAHTYNPQIPGTLVELRMLLDGESQWSYIKDRAAKVLKLETVGEQQHSIASFGCTRCCPKVCPTVSVGVMLKGYPDLMMSMYVVPKICEPLVSQPIDVCISQSAQLAGLKLADWTD